MPEVVLGVRADTKQAINEWSKLTDTQRQQLIEMNRATAAANATEAQVLKLEAAAKKSANSVTGLGAKMKEGFAGLSTILSGAASELGNIGTLADVLKGIPEALQKARNANTQFQRDKQGAASMPDALKNPELFTKTVLDMSEKYGKSAGETAKLKGQIDTDFSSESAANREKLLKMAMQAQSVVGADAGQFASTVDNIRDVFGGKLSIDQSANMSVLLRDKGGMKFEEQAGALEAILPGMEAMGGSAEELIGLEAGISESGGNRKKMQKAMMKIMGKAASLKKKGLIKGTGGMVATLEEIQGLKDSNLTEFEGAFGEESSSVGTTLNSLLNRRNIIQQRTAEARSQIYGGSMLDSIENTMMKNDADYARNRRAASMEQIKANVPLRASEAVKNAAENADAADTTIRASAGTIGGVAYDKLTSLPWVGGLIKAKMLSGQTVQSEAGKIMAEGRDKEAKNSVEEDRFLALDRQIASMDQSEKTTVGRHMARGSFMSGQTDQGIGILEKILDRLEKTHNVHENTNKTLRAIPGGPLINATNQPQFVHNERQ